MEFYYKNHKSDCFEKTKKRKQVKPSTNYLMASCKNWNREMNVASLEILGTASVMAADVDNAVGNQPICSGRMYMVGYCGSKKLHGDTLRTGLAMGADRGIHVEADVAISHCNNVD